MGLGREQRAIVIAAVGRLVRDSWSPEEARPVPDGIARLVSRLEQQDQESDGPRGRITLARCERGDEQMKSRIKRERLDALTSEEREVLDAAAAASAGWPIEELNVDLILDQARALGEL